MELCLWGLLFVPARARDLVLVVYDDRCNLCRRAIAALAFLNVRKTYELQGLSRSHDVLEEFKLDSTAVQKNIHGIFRGNVYVGYALYELITRRNPILWPFFPVLVIGRWLRIGPALYGLFARNRHRMFGTCELTSPVPGPEPHERRPPRVASLLIVAWTIALVTFVLEIPQLRGQLTKIGLPKEVLLDQWILSADRDVGLQQPNVFNEADLRAGDLWPVVYRIGPERPGTLVPFNAPDGHRLAYHRNDIVYYGISLGWRVAAERADAAALHRPGGRQFELLAKLMRFDKKRQGIAGPEAYRVKIFRSPVSNSRIHDTDSRFARTLVYTYSAVIP
jgi:predicted DCC family thiol-disulfide oxidoreductase YuxK